MRCLVHHGDALPITVTQRLGHLSEISFLLFLLSRSAPLLKRLPRRLNQPKKRPGRARIGRYLGLIEAHSRSAPVFLMAPRSTKNPGVGNPSSLKKFCEDWSTCGSSSAKTRGACYRGRALCGPVGAF